MLRKQMSNEGLAAVIVPSNDPHFSEYVADRWKCREWISGFTGSAGTVVITMTNAALWTDSRYFIQAEEQLKDSGILLKKLKIPGTETIEEWLNSELRPKSKVGIDKNLFSYAEFRRLEQSLSPLTIVPTVDLFDTIWTDRPAIPSTPAFILDDSITGEKISSKLNRLREVLNSNKCYIYPISMLDETAWLYNLRGSDIDYNPLAIAYSLVTCDKAFLFINPAKLSPSDKDLLAQEGVSVQSYESIGEVIQSLDKEKQCIFNPRKIAVGLYEVLEKVGFDLIEEKDSNGTICSFKCVKNDVEQDGFRKAMVDDGLALVKFQRWLEENISNTVITELSAAQKLHELRSQSKGFVGESFGSIMGYREHGAIIHYSATPETDARIQPEGFLLFDTGGQYRYGTTDVTRTVHLGTPNHEEKDHYTRVLKGMIVLSMAKFPNATRGCQLDVLARQALWAKGLNYLHGTGHGIGHFLNVHEGPQSIRMEENPVTLKAGMVTSNEPGVYLEGKYGIRTENVILCKQTDNGFMEFETLTLAPIDTKPIDKSLLAPDEIRWLNSYHQMVFSRLSPMLNADEVQWLKKKTQAI